MLAYAERAAARSCVQVDHVDDLQLIERVLELGAGAVMADGSRLPLDENIALVRAAVGLASATGAAVEAELGRVEGDEDLAQAAREGRLTEPQRGAAVRRGVRRRVPGRLDRQRARSLRGAPEPRLGSTGGDPRAGHRATRVAWRVRPSRCVDPAGVELGIGKVNVNTELREAYLRATADALGDVRETAAVGDLHRTQTVAVAGIVASKLRLLRSEGRR